MASSVVNRILAAMGDRLLHIIDLDVTSYATGGEAFTAALAALPSGAKPLVLSVVGLEDNVFARHDEANDKLILFDEGGQIANTTDVGVVRITCTTRNE